MAIGPSRIDVSQPYNLSSSSGTFTGMMSQLRSGLVNDLGTTSTARSFPTAFGGVPQITANYVGTTTSSSGLYCQANSASSFTLFGAATGTAQWLAHRNL